METLKEERWQHDRDFFVAKAKELGADVEVAACNNDDNLQVAQRGARDWAISARGFNTELANKLLVMIDGRTVYTPLYSGVFWEAQDYLLEDIDRIEVISGPGAALWGANAVNGVININTKSAKDTKVWDNCSELRALRVLRGKFISGNSDL